MREKLYIAYGSNLNLRQMQYRCRTARVVGTSEVKDHELLFRGGSHAVATIEPAEGKSVPVLLWTIRPGDEKALDAYEGFPRFYDKQMLDVVVDGHPMSAMAYVMTGGHVAGTPSQSYLNTIAEGYRSAGFDLDVLRAALRRSNEIHHEEALGYTEWLSGGLDEPESPGEEMEQEKTGDPPMEYAREVKWELLDNLNLLPEDELASIREAIDGYLFVMEHGAGEDAIAEKKEEVSAVFSAVGERVGPFMTPLDEDMLGDILETGAEYARDVCEQQDELNWEQMMGGI